MNFYVGGNNLRKIIEAVYVHIKQSKTSGYSTLPVWNIVLIEAIFIFQGTLSLFFQPPYAAGVQHHREPGTAAPDVFPASESHSVTSEALFWVV